MNLLSRRSVLAIAAVVDIALHARNGPVAAKALAGRHSLPPRHLETLLQSLVRSGILKGTRGPRGGYELARERRRISCADVVRAALAVEPEEEGNGHRGSPLVESVVEPLQKEASNALIERLHQLSIEDLCREADRRALLVPSEGEVTDFTI